MKKILIFIISSLIITTAASAQTGSDFPKSAKQQKSESYGSLFGNNGFQLFGGKDKGKSSVAESSSPKTNAFLWHASLDVIQFMPLASTDFNGGVINTDWYDDHDLKNVKYKVNIIIKSPQLDINSISVKVFKRKLTDGHWQDVKTSNNLALELEEKILAKARELKNIQTETP